MSLFRYLARPAASPELGSTTRVTATKEVLAGLVARVPAGRIGTSEDIASAVEFLASDRASYVTGQVLIVCGGRSIAT
jgi:NAD(P)-dependent dehydrogenase (short-subunit alcohol dehydrogenase family)